MLGRIGGLEIFIVIFCFVVVVFCRFIAARKFEGIAFDKGYDENASAFAMCFWLGIVGYIYVLAMPKLTEDQIQEKRTNKIYIEATKKMTEGDGANSVQSYKEALELFNTIREYKNVGELIAHCERKIQEIENKN